MIKVSTPGRICLFGEHQDYLGLEVIASAVNLRFTAAAEERSDSLLKIKIRDEALGYLGSENKDGLYEELQIDLEKPIIYESKRDYFRSVINVLRKEGFEIPGADIVMDSDIPIGKGMSSSTAMVLAFTKVLTDLSVPDKNTPAEKAALLAWKAEVEEFGEPGGMMDHYACALGGLAHIDFSDIVKAERLNSKLDGCFILFDSLQKKDTVRVLSESKYPVLEAIKRLEKYGVRSIRDFYDDPDLIACTEKLDEIHKRKILANIENYRIQRKAKKLLESGKITDEELGGLLSEHYKNLRDGLNVSTPVIDGILQTALKHGAYGGKINGSGGGGCLYVYADPSRADEIICAVREKGYPGMILKQDKGLCSEII